MSVEGRIVPLLRASRGEIWNMRKSLWIILTVLFGAVGAPNAHADSYTATFTCTGTCGSTPSSTTATFSPSGPNSVGVFTWDSVSWSFLLPTNALPTDSYSWFAFTDTSATGDTHFLTFRITDLTLSSFPNDVDLNSLCPSLQACQIGFESNLGVLNFSPVVTPEPSSITLMLAGIGLLLVLGKR
jgi:hypothetical protein